MKHFDLIIADEIHTMMTPEYSKLFENTKYKYLMGLTATHDITSKNDKGKYYGKYCPVIYEYYESADDGIINKTRFFIVDHYLNNEDLIKIRTKDGVITQGELKRYEYLTENIKKGQRRMIAQGSDNWFNDAANWFWKRQGNREQTFAAMMYLNAIKYRKEFLLNLPSSVKIAKKIKDVLIRDTDGKVLIFSELTAQVNKISSNTVHSKNKEEVNQFRMDEFNAGNLRDLGSCQSLTLGLNLKGASHAIMESYIGSSTRSKQKKGRLDRLPTDNIADMWIIRVNGTQSEKWFDEMVKGFDLSDARYLDSKYILDERFRYDATKKKISFEKRI
jgi:superfamily II DNA or RNA helicase